MPTYDYECSSCHHRFEVFEKVHENGVKDCPKCGRKKAKRMLGIGAGVIFRGSGFHVTDYKKGGGGESKESKPADSKGSEPAKKKTTRKEKKD
jgi:putative FmdB family regulatory protein